MGSLKKMLRVAVIGVGHLGNYHVQKYDALEGVDLVGVVDTDRKRVNEIARLYDLKGYEDFSQIKGGVDAVSLAVPTERHFSMARDLLDRGVHLLIEKPITSRLEDADALIEMARAKDLVIQVGHVERFNPAVAAMEKMVTRPIFMESQRLHSFTTRGTDVDVVLDLMIHDLDIILHIVPSDVKELHAVGMSVITGKTDIANARMIFENGAVANFTASRVSANTVRKIRVFQRDSYLSVDCAKRRLNVTSLDGELTESAGSFPKVTSKMTYPESDPLADEIAAFVNSVNTGKKPVVSAEDGRKALMFAHAIIEQIEGGCKGFRTVC